MASTPWTPEPFEADDGSVPFENFLDDLSDFKAVALDTAISHVLAVRGLDLAGGEWLKPLKQGLYEFRVRHDAEEIAQMFGGEAPRDPDGGPERVLLRLFVHFYGDKVILLLGGYDKGDDTSERRQRREIAEARRLLTQFKERQRRQRKEVSQPKRPNPPPRRKRRA